MSFVEFCVKNLANFLSESQINNSRRAEDVQHDILTRLINVGGSTTYWKEKGIKDVRSYLDFKQQVPLITYEDLVPYIDRIKQGEANVLWLGKPNFLAKTTISPENSKYIPISKDFVENFEFGVKQTLFHYLKNSENKHFYAGKMLGLTECAHLDEVNGILIGFLSGIANKLIPWYLRSKTLPSAKTNCIEDESERISTVAQESIDQNVTLVAGSLPFIQAYFEKIMELAGKKVGEAFTNLSTVMYNGNLGKYKDKFTESLGRKVDFIQTYIVPEGFIAAQYSHDDKDLLLMVDNDIFYEFIPVKSLEEEKPTRLQINEVKLNEEYALVVSTTSGLWGYMLGDVIKFTALNPYKIIVTGHTNEFISAFGEHVTISEIEEAMDFALKKNPETEIVDFTVAPRLDDSPSKFAYYEWFIEFSSRPNDIEGFISNLNSKLCAQNHLYKDLIAGNVLHLPHVVEMKSGCFEVYKKDTQKKFQRVSNMRTIAEDILVINTSL